MGTRVIRIVIIVIVLLLVIWAITSIFKPFKSMPAATTSPSPSPSAKIPVKESSTPSPAEKTPPPVEKKGVVIEKAGEVTGHETIVEGILDPQNPDIRVVRVRKPLTTETPTGHETVVVTEDHQPKTATDDSGVIALIIGLPVVIFLLALAGMLGRRIW